MSQLGGGQSQQIGGVSFGIGVTGAEQAKAQVDATAKSVENLGNQAQAAGAKSAGAAVKTGAFFESIKGINKAYTATVGTILKFIGHLGAITAAITAIGFAAVGGARLLGGLWEAMVKAGKGAQDLRDDIKSLLAEHEKYNAVLARLAVAGKTALTANIDQAAIKASEQRRDSLAAEIKVLQSQLTAYERGEPGVTANVPAHLIPGIIQGLRKDIADRQAAKKLAEDFLQSVVGRTKTEGRLILEQDIRRRSFQDSGVSDDAKTDSVAAPLGAIADLLLEASRGNDGRAK